MKLKNTINVIEFKSEYKFFVDERDGIKPNTVRFINDWTDERLYKFHTATHIKINCSISNDSFMRLITARYIYDNIAIICWKGGKQ